MLKFLKRLGGDERGNIIAIVAATMPLVIGAAGLATDTIQWTLWKRQLQRAADSAAMSGAYTRVVTATDTDSDVSASVAHDLTLNLHTWMGLKTAATVTRLSTSGEMRNPVYVKLQIQQALPFSSMFMSAAPTIIAEATAANVPAAGEYCVISTDKSAAVTGLTISGSTNLNMGSCSMIANSSNPTAAASNNTGGTNGGSGSSVTAASLDAAGGVNYSSQWNITSYNPYSTPIDDPFSSYQSNIPTLASQCTKTVSVNKVGGNGDYDRSTTDTATDTVCMNGTQTIGGNVKLGPATYVINAGDFTMNTSGASLTCDGCTIILTSMPNGTATGSVSLTGGTIDLKPPRPIYAADGTISGYIGNQTWKGIVIYQDPRATDGGGNSQNKINGNSATSVQGAVYFGNQSLQYVGGGNTSAACLQVVSKRVTFGGNSLITAGSACKGFGMNGIGGSRRVRLVA